MPPTENDYFLIIIWGTLILLLMGAVIVTFVFQYQKKHKKHIDQRNALQQTLLRAELEIREQTLQHVGRELHDNIGQMASLIKINLNTINLDNREKAAGKLEDVRSLMRQLITDLKMLSVQLNSDRIVQLGFMRGLEGEVERLNRMEGFDVALAVEGNVCELTPDTTVILYRMVQEVINNIVKHSGAKHIAIAVDGTDNLLRICLRDDGTGFDKDAKIKQGGAGLINLQSRAKQIGAQLSIQSAPGQGTDVMIELPFGTPAEGKG